MSKPWALAAALFLGLSSCGGAEEVANVPPPASAAPLAEPSPSAAPSATPAAAHAARHWTYEGADGPEHWSEIDPKFAACKDGKTQTPIDLSSKAPADKKQSPIAFSYKPVPLQIINNGHTVQVNNTAESFITVGPDRYDLVQFHLHSPAEHTIDGKKFDMELHLVHKSQAGNLAVVGMLLKKGKEIPALKAYWDNLPEKKTSDAKSVSGASIDLAAFIPKKAAFTTYQGSLTTPPCSEGVTWFVLAATGEVSEAQVTKFQAATGGISNRPVQPLNGRAPVQFKP